VTEVNPVGKSLTEVELAYLAGLLDGDGAIMALIEKHPEKRFGFRVRLEINATQSHKDDVDWIPELTGVGYVRRNVRTYQWVVRDQQAVFWLLGSIAPYTRSKKNQVALGLQILQHPIESREDLLVVAQLADALSKFNVRSRQRRKNHAAMVQDSWLP
jgi:predicted regulator of amino acid metabolism with ACT domain